MIDVQACMTPAAALLLTVAAYALALWAYRRSGWSLLLPVLTGSAVVVAVLSGAGVPYDTYRDDAKLLSWLAGPATVALALPLYRQRGRLQGIWWPVMGALLAGSLTAVVSAIGIAWLLGADWVLMMSLAPKSATMPAAMPVAESMGGSPSISAVAVALTGISAAVLSGGILGLLNIRDDMVRGFALGASAHAIGTAQAFQISEAAVGFAALAMGLNAIATSVLVPLIRGLL